MIESLEVLFKLLIVFALADFAFQTDAMARGKNRHNKPTPPQGQKPVNCWFYFLTAHAMIHAGGVYLVTSSLFLGAIELVAHWIIDFEKCNNRFGPHFDQALHFACRLSYVWAVVVFY